MRLLYRAISGLVGQDYRRVVDQGPGDGHPLHLSAGHLVALVPQAVAQPHCLQCTDGLLAPLRGGVGGIVHQGQLHILHGRGLGQEVVALEDEAYLAVAQGRPPVLVHGPDGYAVEPVFSRSGGVQAAEGVEQGGLARAGGAHDGHELPFGDGEGHSSERVDRLFSDYEVAADILESDNLSHGRLFYLGGPGMKGLRSCCAAFTGTAAICTPVTTVSPSSTPEMISVISPSDSPTVTVRGSS